MKNLLPEKNQKFIEAFIQHNHYDRLQGLRLEHEQGINPTYHLMIEDKHLSSPGICHGGVLSGMMDATLGLTALLHALLEDKICSTVEFKINYLNPAHLGDPLKGVGSLEFKGKSLIVTSANIIHQETHKLIAKGMGTFNLYPLSKKAKLYGINT